MRKEMGRKVAGTISKIAVDMAVQVTKAPNQLCPFFWENHNLI